MNNLWKNSFNICETNSSNNSLNGIIKSNLIQLEMLYIIYFGMFEIMYSSLLS